MRPESMFAPVSVLASWTMVVLTLTGYRRIRAVRAGRVPRRAFRLGEGAEVPADVAIVNRNLMNLLEVPILFYVASTVLYVTQKVSSGVVTLAWIYVALRIVHSCIHVTYNRVLHRLLAFTLSNVVLGALWVSLIRRVLLR